MVPGENLYAMQTCRLSYTPKGEKLVSQPKNESQTNEKIVVICNFTKFFSCSVTFDYKDTLVKVVFFDSTN